MYFWFTIKITLVFHYSYKTCFLLLITSFFSKCLQTEYQIIHFIVLLEIETPAYWSLPSRTSFLSIFFFKYVCHALFGNNGPTLHDFGPLAAPAPPSLASQRWLAVIRMITSVSFLITLHDKDLTLCFRIPLRRPIIRTILYWVPDKHFSGSLWSSHIHCLYCCFF